jgi:hypothetical protein
MATHEGKPIIINAGPATEIADAYRARVFQSDSKLKEALSYPDKHLGPPPSHLATAGRLNSVGISVFYGATNSEIALAEVRPPVGSKVAIANFKIIRPLRLLDLHALDSLLAEGSYFDPDFDFERIIFLRNLSKLITKPVLPVDEISEYLPTQAIADFLNTQVGVKLDGVKYKSIQSKEDGMNIMLFHQAASVEQIAIVAGTRFSLQHPFLTRDVYEPDYSIGVMESAPKLNEGLIINTNWGKFIPDNQIDSINQLSPVLRIDIESIVIRHIEGVKFDYSEHRVQRYKLDNSSDNDDVSLFPQ